jgi:hypothetical protein
MIFFIAPRVCAAKWLPTEIWCELRELYEVYKVKEEGRNLPAKKRAQSKATALYCHG